MTRQRARSYVFATDFRIPKSERVRPVLDRHRESLVDLGAQYVFVYESTVEPGRVLVVIGVRTEQPLLNLLRSPYFLDWFDAVGVDDLPAVFAGEVVQRLDVSEIDIDSSADVVVVAVTPVGDIDSFMTHVRGSLADFASAGIRKTLVYQAFDNPREVMFLQQLESEDCARRWVERSDVAADWLTEAGVGAYPAVFIGKFSYAMRFEQTSDTSFR